MTKVFVHGNPETDDVWQDLLDELRRREISDVVTLAPPGFGAPTPAHWMGTRVDYSEWLVDELKAIPGDIDLVGHDWGAGHVFGALSVAPGLVRSWATDCAGLLHPEYVWHDAAQGWQTPDLGETMVAAITGLEPDAFAAVMGPMGMRDEIARKVSERLDAETARCILSLYRSAAQPEMKRLGERFAAASPCNGLVIVAENDHFAGTQQMHEDVARSVGANVCHMAGVGHWWMIEDPVGAADILTAHWAR